MEVAGNAAGEAGEWCGAREASWSHLPLDYFRRRPTRARIKTKDVVSAPALCRTRGGTAPTASSRFTRFLFRVQLERVVFCWSICTFGGTGRVSSPPDWDRTCALARRQRFSKGKPMSNTSRDNPKGTTRNGDRGLKRRNFVAGSSLLAVAAAGYTGSAQAQQTGQASTPRSGKQPNIDRGRRCWLVQPSAPIASEGMMFTDYYAEASCAAGRAAFRWQSSS
jgi:hypothetical protein